MVKRHNIGSSSSYGSEKNVCVCVCVGEKQMTQQMEKMLIIWLKDIQLFFGLFLSLQLFVSLKLFPNKKFANNHK